MNSISKLILSVVASVAAGGIGSLATAPNITTWYAELNKPFFNPPNWIFGPVWTLLYLLIGVSLYLVWTAKYKNSKKQAYYSFAVQLTLNAVWSLVFFGAHQPWAAVVIIALMWLSIIANIRFVWPISKMAAYLLIPYLGWVTFASVLNLGVAVLN